MTETSVIKLFDVGSQHKEGIILKLTSIIELLDFSMQHKEISYTRTGRYGQKSIPYEIYLDKGHRTIRH